MDITDVNMSDFKKAYRRHLLNFFKQKQQQQQQQQKSDEGETYAGLVTRNKQTLFQESTQHALA